MQVCVCVCAFVYLFLLQGGVLFQAAYAVSNVLARLCQQSVEFDAGTCRTRVLFRQQQIWENR
jgi:hypothetical protein